MWPGLPTYLPRYTPVVVLSLASSRFPERPRRWNPRAHAGMTGQARPGQDGAAPARTTPAECRVCWREFRAATSRAEAKRPIRALEPSPVGIAKSRSRSAPVGWKPPTRCSASVASNARCHATWTGASRNVTVGGMGHVITPQARCTKRLQCFFFSFFISLFLTKVPR